MTTQATTLAALTTVVRAGAATCFDGTGTLATVPANTARLDHDPITLLPLGMLVEEARTNFLTFSAQFDNAAWTLNAATVTANAAFAPDGTLSADKLVCNSANTGHYVYQPRTGSNELVTQSVFAKAAEFKSVELRMTNSAAASLGARFDLVGGVVQNIDSPNADYSSASATITALGNGWFRCTLTVLKGTVNTQDSAQFSLMNNAGASSFLGDGTSGLYLWGAQLEAGPFATSYIATTSAAVTRAADVISMNPSPWFNPLAGTLFIEVASLSWAGQACALFALDSGTVNGLMVWKPAGSGSLLRGYSGGNFGAATGNLPASGVPFRAAIGYDSSGARASVSVAGVAATPVTDSTVVNVSRFTLGGSAGAYPFSGWIRKFNFWPYRYADADLAVLTT